MSGYVQGETSDLFDPTTGAWVGVLDRRGQEQLVVGGDVNAANVLAAMQAMDGSQETAARDAIAAVDASGARTAAVLTGALGSSATQAPTHSAVAAAIAAGGGTAGADALLTTGFGAILPLSLGTATAPQAMGMNLLFATDSSTVNGGATTADGTGTYPTRRRQRYLAAANAINRVAGAESLLYVSAAVNRWPVSVAAAIADASPTLGSFMLGLHTYTQAYTSTEPSAQTNCLFVGCDAADTNLFVMHNDGSGVCTKVDTGLARPGQFSTVMITIDNPAGDGSSYAVTVKMLATGATFTTTVTTNFGYGVSTSAFFGRSSLGTAFQAAVDFVGITTGKLPNSGSGSGADATLATIQTTGTSSPITPNRDSGAIIKVPTLGAAITLNLPSNMAAGQRCTIIFQGGGSSPVYAAGYDFGSATAPLMAASSADCVIVDCLMTATNKLKCAYGGTHTWEA